MPDAQMLYVLERVVDYEGTDVWGVFSSLAEAQSVYPDVGWRERTSPSSSFRWWESGGMPDGVSGDEIHISEYQLDARVFCPNAAAPSSGPATPPTTREN